MSLIDRVAQAIWIEDGADDGMSIAHARRLARAAIAAVASNLDGRAAETLRIALAETVE